MPPQETLWINSFKIVCILLIAFATSAVAPGARFTVAKTDDTADGACSVADCSLREAILAANGNLQRRFRVWKNQRLERGGTLSGAAVRATEAFPGLGQREIARSPEWSREEVTTRATPRINPVSTSLKGPLAPLLDDAMAGLRTRSAISADC